MHWSPDPAQTVGIMLCAGLPTPYRLLASLETCGLRAARSGDRRRALEACCARVSGPRTSWCTCGGKKVNRRVLESCAHGPFGAAVQRRTLYLGGFRYSLVSAGALANVRAFAGQDYTGYHTFMALVPAIQMAGQLPSERQALPVLKVLYRNSSRIQNQGANNKDALHHIPAAKSADIVPDGVQLRDAVRSLDWAGAESQFAAIAQGPVGEAFNHLRYAVSEDGAFHAEKYYHTVTEEYAATRPACRWRQVVALARVTASEYGFPAPGYQQACELLRLS